jgi:hypothetical protein
MLLVPVVGEELVEGAFTFLKTSPAMPVTILLLVTTRPVA